MTALALFALKSGVAGGVAHVRARQDDPRFNEAVISTTREDLMLGAGSRYAQASAAEAIGAIAASDQPVVFVGKPCDVASVHKAGIGDKLAVTIGIFCAGAPNLVATDKLLARLGVPATDTTVSRGAPVQGLTGDIQPLVDAALAAQVGETKGPVIIDNGAVLFQVAEQSKFNPQTFAADRAKIVNSMRLDDSRKLRASLLSKLRRESPVETNDQLLKTMTTDQKQG